MPGVLAQDLSVPAHQQLLDAASAAGAYAVYNVDDPNNRTLRTAGATDYVTGLADGLGNLPDVTESDESRQFPVTTLANGRRVLINDGADISNVRRLRAEFASPLAQPLTVFTVLKWNGYTGTLRLFYGATDSYSAGLYFWGGGDYRTVILAPAARAVDTNPLTTWFTFEVSYNNAAGSASVNGADTYGHGSVGMAPLDGLTLGNEYGGGAEAFRGSIGHFIIFDSYKDVASLAGLRGVISELYPIGAS